MLQALPTAEPGQTPTPAGTERWWVSPRAFKILLGAFAAVILASTLYTSFLITSRQRTLSDVSRYNTTWAVSQAALEVSRLESVLTSYALQLAEGQTADPTQAQIRFDIVANRIQVLGAGEAGELIRGSTELLAILDRLRAVAAEGEKMIDHLDRPGVAKELASHIAPLNPGLARIAAVAHDAGGNLVGQDLQQLSRLHWAFSGMLIALIMCCVVLISVLVLHNRVLTRAHREVGELVTDLRSTGRELERANAETIRAVEDSEQQNRILRMRDTELAQQNTRFDAALNNMRQALCMVGPDDRLIVCNQQFLQLFGIPRAVARTGLAASRLFDEIAAGGRHEADLIRRLWQEQKRLSTAGSHGAFLREDRQSTAIQVSHQPMEDGGWVATYEDVTDSRIAQRGLAQAQKMEAIGSLTGGMAHDFNNLLAVISLNLEFLLSRTKNVETIAEPVQRALDAAMRGADLISQLLAFARRQPLAPSRIGVNKWIRSVANLLERMLGEDVNIRLDLGSSIWPVNADATRLETAIVNLATNARDAMPHGGLLTITTRNITLDLAQAGARQEVKPGDYVVIEVSDTGVGMPPEVISRVFEPFFTTKDEGRGTGLGLSMVFGFIRQSGGQITVESIVAENGAGNGAGHGAGSAGRPSGTTFRLHLPRAEGDDPIIPEVPVQAVPEGGKERILLVEDNQQVREITTEILMQFGYQVLATDNPATALDILRSKEIVHLLLSDIVMPGGMDGFRLVSEAAVMRPGIRVLLASGFAEQTTPIIGVRVLGKPFRQAELARAVRETLDSPPPCITTSPMAEPR